MAPLTFADTHNMVAFLTKSNASEGFDQVVDFSNAHMIQTKVIITEDTIRQALRLDDAAGVDCLPNEEIFVELARIGYEKPSTKLTFYKVFANIRRISKGFLGVDTPLFDVMLVKQQVQDVKDAAEDDDDNNEVSAEPTPPLPTPVTPPPSPTQEHIPSPPQAQTAQPSSPPPQQPSQTTDISMTLLNTLLETCATLAKQVANLEQDKIAQAIKITKLKQRVRRLEKKRQFKSSGLKRLRKVGIAQRVESSADTVMHDQEDASKQGEIAELDADEDVTLVDAEENINADVQGRLVESQAKVYHLGLEHAEKVFSMQDTDEAEPAEVEKVIEVVTAAKLMTEVVTTADTTIIAAQVPKAKVKSKDKGKGILIKEPKPLKIQAQIEQDEAFARQLEAQLNANINWDDVMEQVKRKEQQDNTVMRYQALKRKHVTEAQARKNMMKLVQERFHSLEPKNFSDDFLLNTLKLMFEKPNVEVNVWRDQRGRYGLAKVKSWKLFESCGVHIITFTTTLMILLVENKYPLTHFTLEQMLNNVKLEVEEESEMSLELLRLMRRQLQEGYILE
nr:hypothetical protein [Tanacetum cinerariifolium]